MRGFRFMGFSKTRGALLIEPRKDLYRLRIQDFLKKRHIEHSWNLAGKSREDPYWGLCWDSIEKLTFRGLEFGVLSYSIPILESTHVASVK